MVSYEFAGVYGRGKYGYGKMIAKLTDMVIDKDDRLLDSAMPSKPIVSDDEEEEHTHEFNNESTGETVEVDESGFDEATTIMLEPKECSPSDWKLVSVDEKV